MKKVISLKLNRTSFPKICLTIFVAISSFSAHAQSLNYGIDKFVFHNSTKEWSDSLKITLGSDWMTKKGQPHVPLAFRMRMIKKVALACHYEVEITNLSDVNGIKFEMDDSYSKDKVKLRPGKTVVERMIFADLNCKMKTVEDCTKCIDIVFHGVEGIK